MPAARKPNPHKNSPKRKPAQIAADEVLIEKMALEGYTCKEIAAHIGKVRPYTLHHCTVQYILAGIKEDWKKEVHEDISRYVSRELKGLDKQEKELWKAWRKSQKDAESETITDSEEGRSIQRKREGQVGAVQFQNALLEIRSQRRALLGLDKPKKIAATDPTGEDFAPLVITGIEQEDMPKAKKDKKA